MSHSWSQLYHRNACLHVFSCAQSTQIRGSHCRPSYLSPARNFCHQFDIRLGASACSNVLETVFVCQDNQKPRSGSPSYISPWRTLLGLKPRSRTASLFYPEPLLKPNRPSTSRYSCHVHRRALALAAVLFPVPAGGLTPAPDDALPRARFPAP